MQKAILHSVKEGIQAVQFLQREESLLFIESAVKMLLSCFQRGGKLLISGNGGSLCDAMHFAEELTGFFRSKRPPLPALVLSDPAHLTCVGNDIGFHAVFSRAVEAYGQIKDILIVLSTSGNSQNLIKAVKAAKEKGLFTIAFLGKDGGKLKGTCDLEWIVSGFSFSDRIQEAHMTAIHIIIEMVEQQLFFTSPSHEKPKNRSEELPCLSKCM